MSKKRTGVRRMALNMVLCRDCAHLTSTLNSRRFLVKPKRMVAPVKPVKRSRTLYETGPRERTVSSEGDVLG